MAIATSMFDVAAFLVLGDGHGQIGYYSSGTSYTMLPQQL